MLFRSEPIYGFTIETHIIIRNKKKKLDLPNNIILEFEFEKKRGRKSTTKGDDMEKFDKVPTTELKF